MLKYHPLDFVRPLGGVVTGPNTCNVPSPGHPLHDRGLSITCNDSEPGYVFFSHNGSSFAECAEYIERGLGVKTSRRREPVKTSRRRDTIEPKRRRLLACATGDADRTEPAMRIWHETTGLKGTLAETYLVEARGTGLPEAVIRGGALRFASHCPFRGDDGTVFKLPAMIALLTDALSAEPTGIHRTALKADGSGKADNPGLGNPKKMLGRARGSVIRLCADEDVHDGIGLAEGVENAIAVISTGWTPVWAAGSAGSMANFPVLAGIQSLSLFADTGNAGEQAAAKCAERWLAQDREVTTYYPRHGDWNDMTVEMRHG